VLAELQAFTSPDGTQPTKSARCAAFQTQQVSALSRVVARAQARSLLTAHEDFVTLQFHAPAEIQRPGYVFACLKRHLPDERVEEVKRMSMTADGRCAVFDVPAAYVEARPRAAWAERVLQTDCRNAGCTVNDVDLRQQALQNRRGAGLLARAPSELWRPAACAWAVQQFSPVRRSVCFLLS